MSAALKVQQIQERKPWLGCQAAKRCAAFLGPKFVISPNPSINPVICATLLKPCHDRATAALKKLLIPEPPGGRRQAPARIQTQE